MSEFRKPRSLFFPLLLIAAGVFIFLINIGTVQGTTWENLLQYWPVILIIGGLDGLYKRDGWVGPLVLIGLGTILLLGNLHYIESGGFALLLRLWPVLLVAIGLDIIFGHRGSVWNNLIRVFLGLFLVAAIVWLATLSPFVGSGMKSVPFSQTLDNATQSDVRFSVAVGEIRLAGGAGENILVSGKAGLPKEMTLAPVYTAPMDGKSTLVIGGSGVVIVPVNTVSMPWDFKINSKIPVDLRSALGIGEMVINLTGTHIANLEAKVGVGSTTVTLPAGIDVDARISGAIGELVIRIPKGSEVRIKTDTAIVGTTFPEGFMKNGDIIRSTGVGANPSKINIEVDLAIGSVVIQEVE